MNWYRLNRSFRYAWLGIRELWQGQQNFRIEFLVAVAVIVLTYVFHIRSIERGLIVLMILLVFASEVINSVLENILDGISTEYNAKFKAAKDIMAGLTLLMALGAVLVPGIIFWPYLRFYLFG